jgi:hypothetical protein
MKSNYLLTTSLSLAAALLTLSCAPDATSPILANSGERSIGTLNNGQDGHEYAHASGTIAEIDYDNMRLRVGDVWFWADEQTKIKIDDFDGKPSFGDLATDDPVEIEYRTPADDGMGFYAKEIEVEDADDLDDGEGKYYEWAEGYVEEVDADNMRFRIGEMWFWVDENTTYCDDDDHDGDGMYWTFEDIQPGVWLKARYHTMMDEEKGYYAKLVVIKPDHEFEWAEGYVEEVDADNMRLRVGEMWFWADEHTAYCDDDDVAEGDEMCWTFEDLVPGLWVKIKYRPFLDTENGYYAMKVIVKPNHEFEWAEGQVTDIDADNMRFQIGEMWFWVDENTTYCDEDDDNDHDDMCRSFEDIQPGVWVKTKYRTFVDDGVGYYAMKVIVKYQHESVEAYVDEVDGDGMRVRIGDDWYWADEHTEIEIEDFAGDPTFADIEAGDLVKIQYLTPAFEGKGFYAKEIEVKADS